MQKYCKLILISEANNNKYYEMLWDGISAEMTIKYGRVDSTCITIQKPSSQWRSVYQSKLNKGYTDVTHLVSVNESKSSGYKSIPDLTVNSFMTAMMKYTNNLVADTYSVKATSVTQAQITQAQYYIDVLNKGVQEDNINHYLIELYKVIPRYMSKVKDYLYPVIDIKETLQKEQDNLDAMASQVALLPVNTEAKTLLEVLKLEMKGSSPNKDLKYLLDQIPSRTKVDIYEVDKPSENEVFFNWLQKQSNKDTRILIHGTRCSSVIPILQTGLQIRPSGNFSYSGKVYGNGNYYSETVVKSMGYTGNDRDKILLVYEVHVGNPFIYNGRFYGNDFALTYENLKQRGFDSTYVKAGNGLLNSEIIAYTEQQQRLRYILHLQ